MTTDEKLELPISWGWFLALGISMVIFGTLGIVFAFYLTLVSVIMFGVLAIVSGILQLSHGVAGNENNWSGKALHLLVALMYILFGGLVVFDPVSGSYSLTLVLAAFLVIVGISRIAYAWKCWNRGWKWRLMLLAGGIDVLLAALIMYGWPETAFWMIGLFVAIEMMTNGWLLIAMALAKRTLTRENKDFIQTTTAEKDPT
ncbi:HdeD family acid-resistance protein [Nitrosomonas sp. JL21]|uniref:HdeD family acid-resistance protein n=1 Tax=Nitrosomonas sp. JL21 TaxID=153949 RepID=UPI00136BF62F|nr:DUF308 domain-containing protein [Nitrosomonas sp. JL21]MBL8496914.1 DUF308 domain-containing protein [Nitrosomonas sp.]MXS78488.1 HdeD family acid-resistance protein [Nitrosomonas sp. JL21]